MTNINFIQPWLDYQKKFLDYWQQNGVPSLPIPEPEGSNTFSEFTRPWQAAIQQWGDLASDAYQNQAQITSLLPLYKDFMSKFANWPYLDQGLKRLWDELSERMSGTNKDPFQFIAHWNKEYGDLFLKQLNIWLPDQIRPLLDKSLDLYALSSTSTGEFLKPWLDRAQSMHNLLLKSLTGDQSSYLEYIKLWQESFASSFGKMVSVPQFSLNREYLQKQMSSLNALITLINTLNEYVATLVKTSQETMEKLIGNYQVMVVKGNNPNSFKEFYDYWWKQNEAAYLQLFSTPEFARLSGQLLEAGCNYKKNYDDLMERQLEFLPYPTRTDMDSLYKTVDTMKREIRGLKKELLMLQKIVVETTKEV